MPGHKISSRYKYHELLPLQEELVGRLDRYWTQGKEIIFIDECSCDSWLKSGRVWMEAKRPFFASLTHKRGKGVQV